jgi:hypothetical protein
MSYVQNATRRFLLTSLPLLVLSSALHGQTSSDESARRQVTAVAGSGNDMGWLGVGAEFYFSGGRLSGFGGVGYTPEIDQGDPTGLTVAAGVRAYTLGIKHRGFVELSLSQVAILSRPAFFGGGERYYGPGIQVGYQYVRAGGFTFVVSGGVGYALDVDEVVTASSVGPLLNLGLGYTWRRP